MLYITHSFSQYKACPFCLSFHTIPLHLPGTWGLMHESRTVHLSLCKATPSARKTQLFTCTVILAFSDVDMYEECWCTKFLRSRVPSFTSLAPDSHAYSGRFNLVPALQCCHTITQFSSLVYGCVLPWYSSRYSAGRIVNRLRAVRSAVPIPAGVRNILFCKTSNTAPGTTHPLIQRIPAPLSRR
jgi:hypothetical protein